MIKKWLKANTFLLGIIALAIILRFTFITSVPVSSNDDQIHYMINSQSFLLNGKDISGTTSPLDILLFKYPPHEFPQAELPYFLEMLSFSLFGATFLASLLPNIFLSIGTVIVAYLVGKELLGKEAGLAIGLISAINPWSIFIGRTAYEPTAASFFFLLALFIFLRAKKWMILLSIPVLYAAFYAYIGTKLIFLPFILICILYSYFFVHKKRFALQYIIVFLASTLIVGVLFLQLKTNSGNSRLNEIFLPTNPAISQQVDYLRKQSLNSPVDFITNKITIYGEVLAGNTFKTISPMYLFMTGDYFFSQQRHGLFYIVDAFFILLGIVGLYKKEKKVLLLFISFSAVGLLPQIMHGGEDSSNFTPHIILVISTLLFLVGYGIVFAIHELKPRLKKPTIALITAVYVISLSNFLLVYFLQAPRQAGIFNFAERVAARYITESAKMNNVTVVSSNPAISYRNYVFYSQAYKKDTANEINNHLTKNGDFALNRIHFVQCHGKREANSLIVIEGQCSPTNNPSIKIPDLVSLNTSYIIENDKICKNVHFDRYQHYAFSDLNVEKLSISQLCHRLLVFN